jgi:hypothetical protein
VRSVGASLGSQVTAAILAGSATAGSLPTDGGFTTAFVISAGVATLAAAVAVVIPRGEHHAVRERVAQTRPALAKR